MSADVYGLQWGLLMWCRNLARERQIEDLSTLVALVWACLNHAFTDRPADVASPLWSFRILARNAQRKNRLTDLETRAMLAEHLEILKDRFLRPNIPVQPWPEAIPSYNRTEAK